jgi:hypothetical protein
MEVSKMTSFLFDKYRIIVAGLSRSPCRASSSTGRVIRSRRTSTRRLAKSTRFIGAMQALLKT